MGQHTVKIWMKTLAAIALSGGLAVGCTHSVPDAPTNNNSAPENSASRQNPLTAYARSILEIEPLRTQAYEKIMAADSESSQPPAMVCNDRNTLAALRGDVKTTAIKYCQDAKAIAEKQGLTPEDFNKITQQLENDPQLKEAIKNELMKLQQSLPPTS